MGLLSILKSISKSDTPQSKTRTLKKEEYRVAGSYFYEENIKKLSERNPDWKKTAASIIKEGKAGRKIFRYNYIHKPVKLIPEPTNKHDRNAVQVIIAGELVGYIPAEESLHVKKVLSHNEVKYISSFISGGEYKIIDDNGDTFKNEYSLSITVTIGYV